MSHIDEIRNKIHLDLHTVRNTEDTCYPGTYTSYDDSWNFAKFQDNFSLEIVTRSQREVEFDMVGIDTPFANSFRRILIADVPTMAVEEVFIHNNTSVMQDEVLAHRIGLLPINVDPRLFEMKKKGDSATEQNTLQFRLKVRCKRNKKAPADTTNPDELYLNSKVYTRSISWEPLGEQKNWLPGGVRFTEDDILVNVLRPGQELDMVLHAVKGIGSDHAKFSPVATATYRLMPEIQLLEPVRGALAEKLKECFSPGVIEVEEGEAVVKNARLDSGSREVLRHVELADKVKLLKLRNHFIFNIESTGALDPLVLMREAVKILKSKCTVYRKELDVLTT